jgi:hypothetical protein
LKQLPKFFEQILGIEEPWYIKEIKQEETTGEIEIFTNSPPKGLPRLNKKCIISTTRGETNEKRKESISRRIQSTAM